MSRTYNSFNKVCATCAYWTGSRASDNFGTTVTTQDDNYRAKCMCQRGPWRMQVTIPSAGCNSYKKWDILK